VTRFPAPVTGLVIRYGRWSSQAGDGEGKDRPCAIVLAMQEAPDGTIRVVVAPITHTPPADPDASIEIPAQVKARLGLDGERSWVRLDEVNRFVWPGYDLRSTGPAGRMGLWDAPRRPLCSGNPRHPGVAGGPQGQGEEPGLGPMLFS
jgi:hypothetical protein